MNSLPIGAPTQERIFESVGRALSRWEWIEGHVAVLFSRLIGQKASGYAAARAFGTLYSVNSKRLMIAAAAEVFFLQHSAPETQAKLAAWLGQYQTASASRNQIAHGIVQTYAPGGYALFPNWSATKSRKIKGIALERTEANYVYSSHEIDAITQKFAQLYEPLMEIITEVMSAGTLPPLPM
ncbi:hypothetical protein ACVDG8_018855 [Mesorhizobium sp. ORM8.1]